MKSPGNRSSRRARLSMEFLISFILSLSFTPNLCSSSIIIRPGFFIITSFCMRRCVPTAISTLPSSRPFRTAFCSFFEQNGHHSYINRKIFKSLLHIVIVLFCKNCCRSKKNNLSCRQTML